MSSRRPHREAIKLTATVRANRTVELKLPKDVPEGSAEITVLVPEPTATDVDAFLRSAAEWRRRTPNGARRLRSTATLLTSGRPGTKGGEHLPG